MSDLFEQALLNMGIYELRNYARELGVNSPTTLKRQELISAIKDVKNGVVEPVKGLTRGRKPKNKDKINLNTFIPQEHVPYNTDNSVFKSYNVAAPITPYGNHEQSNNEFNGFGTIISGQLEFLPNGGVILKSDNLNLEIDSQFLKDNNFENGEIVKANCQKTTDNEIIITEVFKDNAFTNFANLEACSKNRNLIFKPSEQPLKDFSVKYKIMAGQCGLITYKEEINPEYVVESIIQSLNENGDGKIAILSNQLENQTAKKNFDFYQTVSALESATERAKKIETALNVAKRKVELNNSCILFIGNLNAFYNTFYQLCLMQGNSESISKDFALQKIAQILAMAKQTKQGALTVIAFAQEDSEKTDYCEDLINLKINFEEEKEKYCLKKSFSIFKWEY